jgi:rhodanese-related sulfurtransferase
MKKHTFQPLCSKDRHVIDLFQRIDDYMEETTNSWNYIIAPDLIKELKKGNENLFLLDVRKPDDFSEIGHISGSVNVFWKDLFKKDNIDQLPCPKHNPNITIVIICYVGHTASQTLVLLRLLGYRAVVLKYGMGISPVKTIPRKGWMDYNYPLEFEH